MVMLQYGIFTGGSVSSMRAVCMFVLSVGAKILGRTYDILTALAVFLRSCSSGFSCLFIQQQFFTVFWGSCGCGFCVSLYNKNYGYKGQSRKSSGRLCCGAAFYTSDHAGILWRNIYCRYCLNLAVLPTVSGVLLSGLCCSMIGFINQGAASAAAVPRKSTFVVL